MFHGEMKTVGNTVIDAIKLCLSKRYYTNKMTDSKNMFESFEVRELANDFVLVTIHGAKNVDYMRVLR